MMMSTQKKPTSIDLELDLQFFFHKIYERVENAPPHEPPWDQGNLHSWPRILKMVQISHTFLKQDPSLKIYVATVLYE